MEQRGGMQQILADTTSMLQQTVVVIQDQVFHKKLEEAADEAHREHLKEKADADELKQLLTSKRSQVEAAEREVELLKLLISERSHNLQLLGSIKAEADKTELIPLTSAKTSTRVAAQQQELARLSIQQSNYDAWLLEADRLKKQPICCRCQFSPN
jgi:hypothetical protein